MTPFATQPIRAAYFPAINEGEPTGCRTEFSWGCTLSGETWQAFKYNFDRGQYSKPPLAERQAPFTAQVGMWWLYFRWQWLRDAYAEMPRLQAILGAVFLMLGFFGGYVHWRRDKRSFAYFGPLIFSVTLALIYYLNFKYGASQGGIECDRSVPCEVRDRDYFFLWSFSAWSVWAALGLVFVWESIAALAGARREKVGNEYVEVPFRKSWLQTSPILLIGLIPLFGNWRAASRSGETDTADFARDMLNSVEPYGVLITVGDNDTFPIWYAQEVEGVRRDVVLINTSLANTDWYPRQIIRRPIFEYDREKGPAIYNYKDWPKPSGPPLRMSLDEVDGIALAEELRTPMMFAIPGTEIRATINKADRTFWKADYVVLRALQDSKDERPVYFSRTSGNYGYELGLLDHLLTQGLAQKVLMEKPTGSGKDTVRLEDGWFDVQRTKALWDSVYTAPASLLEKNKWIDFPSQGIPYLFVATGVTLGHVLQLTGDNAGARNVLLKTADLVDAVKLEIGMGWVGISDSLRNMVRAIGADTSEPKALIPLPGKSDSGR
jgi:hypothetical protein